jgi:hypothetical protein
MKPVNMICVAMLLTLGAAPSEGAIVANDDFSYPDGILYGANGGTGWTSRWGGTGMDVAGSQAVTNVFNNPPKYGSRDFDNPQTTGELFVSVDLLTATIGINDYFGAQLYLGVNNNILSFGKLPGSNEFQVFNGGGASTGITIAPNTAYHLVGAYSVVPGPATDRLLLWVNPDSSDFFNVVTGANSADAVSNELVAFGAFSLSLYAGTPGFKFDNLVISNTADGVGLAVPEPGSMQLLLTGAAMLFVVARRRE